MSLLSWLLFAYLIIAWLLTYDEFLGSVGGSPSRQ
jgi:hypothetical protein